MTAKNTADVVVREPFQVTHDGIDHRGGDRASVPNHVAEHWHRNGWVDHLDDPPEPEPEPEAPVAKKASSRRRR